MSYIKTMPGGYSVGVTDTGRQHGGAGRNMSAPTTADGVELVDGLTAAEAAAMRQQYNYNQSSARESMAFEAEQAQLARDWQTAANKLAWDRSELSAQRDRDWQALMSNTAYQRAVKDLRAAGLNPILAYSQGGATTPSGASASGYTSSASTARGHQSSTSHSQSDASKLSAAAIGGLGSALVGIAKLLALAG